MDADVPFYFPRISFSQFLHQRQWEGGSCRYIRQSFAFSLHTLYLARHCRWRPVGTRPAPAEKCWVGEEESEKKHNNYEQFWFPFWDKTLAGNREHKSFSALRGKCVINENKIIDKKKRSERSFPFLLLFSLAIPRFLLIQVVGCRNFIH